MAQMDSSPAYSETDLKICFSILKYLQSQLDGDTIPKELRESLEGKNVLVATLTFVKSLYPSACIEPCA